MLHKRCWVWSLIISLFISSCTLDEGKKVQLEELSLDTTDDSEIFFKNLRQSSYERQEVERMTVFKNKDYLDSEDSIQFQAKIVWSWYNDKAFILLETSAGIEDSIKFDLGTQADLITSESASAAEQTYAACEIYNSLVDKQVITMMVGQACDTLFKSNLSKEAFRVTMSDYLRLTNNF
jgi:hypothetical protein